MGKKAKSKRTKGARRDGERGHRATRRADKPLLTGTSGGFTGLDAGQQDITVGYREQDQLTPPYSWLPDDMRDKPRREHPDALFVKLQPEDADRPMQRGHIEAVSSGNANLPGWFTPHEPEPARLMALRPGEMLDVHARLAEVMARPPARLIEFFDAFVSDTMDRAGSRGGDWEKVNVWAGMFYPAQSAPEWCGILARQLKTARPYQITAPMMDLVNELYQRTMEVPTLIRREHVPWPAGFVWLDQANQFTDPHGNQIYNRAYSWDLVYLPGKGGQKVPGIRVNSWSHPEDRDSYWTSAVPPVMSQFGGLGMGNSIVFQLGLPVEVAVDPAMPSQDSVPRWLRCLWAVLESEVSASAKAGRGEISHGIRRRAARSLDHTEVTVVTLRRTLTLAAEPSGHGPAHRNWTCRWVVGNNSGGFWRHARRDQDWEAANEETDGKGRVLRHHAIPDADRMHCITCGVPVSHIDPYAKGPAGLPWKVTRGPLYKLQR